MGPRERVDRPARSVQARSGARGSRARSNRRVPHALARQRRRARPGRSGGVGARHVLSRAARPAAQAAGGARGHRHGAPEPDLGRSGRRQGAARPAADGVPRAGGLSLVEAGGGPLPLHDAAGRTGPRRVPRVRGLQLGDRGSPRPLTARRRARARGVPHHARHGQHGRGHDRGHADRALHGARPARGRAAAHARGNPRLGHAQRLSRARYS